VYRFSYVAESQRLWAMGATHASDVSYVFDRPQDEMSAADMAEASLTSAYWVSCATSGNPNGGSRPLWPRHYQAADKIVNFTNTGLVVGPDPLKVRLDLWETVWSSRPASLRRLRRHIYKL
jgi:para-nitrobenzyl esterase